MSTPNAALEKPTGEYRQYVPDLNIPRFETMCTQDAHEYAHAFKTGKQPPWLHALYMHWLELLKEPFKGVTTDGKYENYLTRYRIALCHCDPLTLYRRSCSPRSIPATG